MITIERKHYGLDGYWRGKWIGTLARRYVIIKFGSPRKVLGLTFGYGKRDYYENHYGDEGTFTQIKPTRGVWGALVDGRRFQYWQPVAIIREISKITHAST